MKSKPSPKADHLAKLANLPLTANEVQVLDRQFGEVLEVVDRLDELDTSKIEATPQVTGLKNRFREDETDDQRILSQDEALANAKNSHNGYFVVEAVFEAES